MPKTKILAILAAMSCGAAGVPADAGTATAAARAAPPATATPSRVVRVAIFKNGYGFVFREVAVRGGAAVRIDGAPQAVLGTLWAYPTDGDVSVRSFRAVEGRGTEERDCATVADLLRSSVGRRVRLTRHLEEGNVETVDGTIARAVSDDLFLLQTQGPEPGFLTFSSGSYDTVVFVDQPVEECSAEVDRTQLVIDVAGSGAGKIEYTALERGLRWVPEYRVERIAGDKVRVTLQSAIVNDVVDLEDAAVDLVVGVPHYLMSGTLSPLVLEGALEDVAQAAYRQSNARWAGRESFSNVMQTQMAVPQQWEPPAGGEAAAADLGAVGTADADELSLYHVEHVTLRKGERALVRVFSTEVPVEDIYKWEVVGTEAEATALLGQALQGDPTAIERVAQQRVWHHLRISNRTDLAWTTGPAVAFVDGNVVAQDRITYTPAGAAVDLKLTMAADVLVRWNDSEEERERNAMEIDDVWWDLVRGRGELTINSHEDQPIQLVVVRRIVGTLADPSDGGRVQTDPGGGDGWSPMLASSLYGWDYGYLYYDWGRSRVNSPSWCEWKLTVRPNETKTLRYGFRYYVR